MTVTVQTGTELDGEYTVEIPPEETLAMILREFRDGLPPKKRCFFTPGFHHLYYPDGSFVTPHKTASALGTTRLVLRPLFHPVESFEEDEP